MTTKEAKKVPIESYLQTLGFNPVNSRKGGTELWYNSPLKKDKTASFKVDTNRNTWYDFSLSKGGSIIDFVIVNSSCNVSEAFKKISESKAVDFVVKFKPTFIAKPEVMVINSIKNLQNQALISYIIERRISVLIAQKYLLEIYYSPGDKKDNYFALGFKNTSEGYEVRNKYFKGCIGKKSISFVQGKNRNSVSIFEGFFDFLSVLEEKKILELKTDVIILNSITQLHEAMKLIGKNNYTKIFSFLDNDDAGSMATNQIQEQFKGSFLDMRYLYKSFKDYNQKLMK